MKLRGEYGAALVLMLVGILMLYGAPANRTSNSPGGVEQRPIPSPVLDRSATGSDSHAGQGSEVVSSTTVHAPPPNRSLSVASEARSVLADTTAAPKAREAAAERLAHAEDPTAFDALVELAGTADPLGRSDVALALAAKVPDVRASATLEVLLSDPDAAVRASAARSLQAFGAREREALVVRARTETSADTLAAIFDALGTIGTAEDVPLIVSHERDADPVGTAAQRAARALAGRAGGSPPAEASPGGRAERASGNR